MASKSRLGCAVRIALSLVVVLGLGSMACIELAYRAALRGISTMPQAPSGRVPAPVEARLWAYFDGTPTPEMRPIYPWHIATWIGRALVGKPSLSPGFNIAGTVASMHLRSLGRQERELTGHLRGFCLIVWVSRHFSASEAVSYWAARTRGPRGSTGLDEASRAFFDRPPKELTLSQLALLLAVTWNPEKNDPWCHRARAMELRQRTLDRFVRAGVLPSSEAVAAAQEPLAIVDRVCPGTP